MPALDLVAWLLVGLWAAVLGGGFLFGRDPSGYRRMPTWTRMGSSAVLVLLGWHGLSLASEPASVRYATLITLGIAAGFAGDLAMARLLPAGHRVLAGMTAFALGHVAYIAAITGYGRLHWTALTLWVGLGLILAYSVLLHGRHPTTLHWAALFYALFLAATAGVATGLALQNPLFIGLAVGAALFLVSDLILATELFNRVRFPFIGDLIWLTYGPGQALIVTSIWATFPLGG